MCTHKHTQIYNKKKDKKKTSYGNISFKIFIEKNNSFFHDIPIPQTYHRTLTKVYKAYPENIFGGIIYI